VAGGIITPIPESALPPPIRPVEPLGGAQVATAGQPGRISSIQVIGLSDQARADLLASLPVHEGDTITFDQLNQVNQAVKAFDEHLVVLRSVRGTDTTLTISPAAQALSGMLEARRQALASSATDNVPPPPPAPSGLVSSPDRIKVGGNVQSAMIVSKVPPVYPNLAKSAHVEGVVKLAVVIAKDGTIQEIHSLGGPALLIGAAMDAVKQWVYRPTLVNGEPVAVETTIDVNFTLNQ
jgi:TonB family protein